MTRENLFCNLPILLRFKLLTKELVNYLKLNFFIQTHSELIRLDEAGLFAGKRGMSSDVMKWLRYQAEWGSMSAQVL